MVNCKYRRQKQKKKKRTKCQSKLIELNVKLVENSFIHRVVEYEK